MPVLDDPLRLLDHITWRHDPDYSQSMRETLKQVYDWMDSPSTADHQAAYSLLISLQGARMARQQELRVWYAMGKVSMEIGATPDADNAFYFALEIALPSASITPLQTDEAIEAAIASIELAQLHARVQHWQGRYKDASESLTIVLDLLDELPAEARTSRTQSLKVHVLKSLADYHFMLGEYDVSLAYIDRAESLLPWSTDPIRERASVLWTKTLLHRWRGEPDRALSMAQEAVEIFTRLASPSLARANILVVECALDLATYFASGDGFLSYFTIAGSYLKNALELTEHADDSAARGLATLAQTRFERFVSPTIRPSEHEARLTRIEQALLEAKQDHDVALGAAALTELGREYEADGNIPRAMESYQAVLDLLKGTDMPAMAVWAKRGLNRLERLTPPPSAQQAP